jgi:hypothetical protein
MAITMNPIFAERMKICLCESLRAARSGCIAKIIGRIAPILMLLTPATTAWAHCPTPPKAFSLPPPREAVNLVSELEQPWQAGGAITVACGPQGWPQAGRLAGAPADRNEEMRRRKEAWNLVRQYNLARKAGEVKARSLPITPEQEALIERFAMSDAGAVWMRKVVDDSLRLFNQGDLEARREVWGRARKTGRMPKLAELLTGRLTEGGEFNQDSRIFKFYAYPGEGAEAEPGIIGLGDAGFRRYFPASSQIVDPLAILSHEFGHTRYGDPASAGSLRGEAETVARYENPVRLRNGFDARTVYYVRPTSNTPESWKDGFSSRLIHLQSVEGITVEERQAIERIFCECAGPLPVVLDCTSRQGKDAAASLTGLLTSDLDCSVRWKRDEIDEDKH